MIPNAQQESLCYPECGVRRNMTSEAGAFKAGFHQNTYSQRNPDLRGLAATFKTQQTKRKNLIRDDN